LSLQALTGLTLPALPDLLCKWGALGEHLCRQSHGLDWQRLALCQLLGFGVPQGSAVWKAQVQKPRLWELRTSRNVHIHRF